MRLQSRVMLDLSQRLALIQRYVTPLNPAGQARAAEAEGNPDFDELLMGVPFNDARTVRVFFKNKAKNLALYRYVLGRTSWDANKFVYEVVGLICTPHFRRNHFYPGKAK